MEILFSEETVAARVRDMGREIETFYRGREPLTLIALLNGALPFAADLMRRIDLPLWIDTLAVGSYKGNRSSGEPTFRSQLKLPVENRHVLLVDEVLDTGTTLRRVTEYLGQRGALSVKTAVLVEKSIPRPPEFLHADWTGFVAPDRYLVGCGLDSDEQYRQLPFIAALD